MEKQSQCISWTMDHEMSFIDDCINGLLPKERAAWLQRYLQVSMRRTDWGDMNGQKVINYIQHVLLLSNLMQMNLKPSARR